MGVGVGVSVDVDVGVGAGMDVSMTIWVSVVSHVARRRCRVMTTAGVAQASVAGAEVERDIDAMARGAMSRVPAAHTHGREYSRRSHPTTRHTRASRQRQCCGTKRGGVVLGARYWRVWR